MGAQASKQVARRYPKHANQEARSSKSSDSPSTLPPEGVQTIEDVRDPQLHKNLAALGPVKVEPTVTKFRTSDPMLHILRERQRIEENEPYERLSDIPNRATIDVIFSALERRKHLAPGELDKPETLQQMERDYRLDQPTLKTLLKYYNTIAVLPAASDDDRKKGIWVNDKVEWRQAVDQAIAENKRKQEDEEPTQKTSSSEKTKKTRQLQDLFED